MPTVFTEGKQAEDVLLKVYDYSHCVESVNVFNPNDAGGPINFVIGEVMKLVGANYQKNTDNSGDAVLLEPVTALADNGSIRRKALVRGPALVNSSQLNHNGGVAATQLAALLAKGIKSTPEPTKVSTGA